jgi:hypothetical protein
MACRAVACFLIFMLKSPARGSGTERRLRAVGGARDGWRVRLGGALEVGELVLREVDPNAQQRNYAGDWEGRGGRKRRVGVYAGVTQETTVQARSREHASDEFRARRDKREAGASGASGSRELRVGERGDGVEAFFIRSFCQRPSWMDVEIMMLGGPKRPLR